MATNVILLMKDIQLKWKKGFKIANTQEFLSLVVFCSSENSYERIAACKCIEYLLDWKVIEVSHTLNLLTSLASRSKDTDGLLAVCFNIISNICLSEELALFKDDLTLFLQSVGRIIAWNDCSVPVIVSLFDQLDITFITNHFRRIVYDMVFGEHPHRSLVWRKFSKRIDIDLHRNLLLWLKYSRIEDCFFLLESLKILGISNTEKCLHLSAVIRHMLSFGFNPKEAINMLYDYILDTNIHTQSLVLLTILLGIDSYSDLYIFVVLDLCSWFLNNTVLWKEVLWIIPVVLIPLSGKSVIYPNYQLKAKELIDIVQEKADSGNSIELEFTEINSVILKHVIYRHDCLHQSLLMTRLLGRFKNDDNIVIEWLNKLLTLSQDPMFKVINVIIGKCFLTNSPEIRRICLTIFEKWKIRNVDLYIFQLSREKDPLITLELLRILATKCTTDGSNIADDFLNRLPEDHENNFNLKIDLLKLSCVHGYKLDDSLPIILSEKKRLPDILAQAALVKDISSALNIHFEVTIPFCNNLITTAKNSGGTIATAFVIDAICIMCEKGFLDVSVIWNSLLSIVAGDYHPAVHISVCNLLSKVPCIIRKDIDYNRILYKSARVLWHYVNDSSANQEVAIRSLREYDLDVFDATFLSEDCKSHLKGFSEDSDNPKIQGNCWVHMIKNHSLAELFVHLVNKKYSTARYYGSYCALFEALVNYLAKCPLADEEQITLCLKIMCANWTRVPAGRKISCFDRFLSENRKQEIRELALLAALNFFPSNDSARYAFEDFISKKKYSESEKATMCINPANLLERHRNINEYLLFEGLLYAFDTNFFGIASDSGLNKRVEEAIISCAKNESVHYHKRRAIMKVLVTLWAKVPFEHEVFKRVCKILITIYGYPFVKSLPHGQFTNVMCKKLIYLCREMVLKTKSLYCYDTAIYIGHKNESLQEDIVENFLYILAYLGDEKRSNNKKWILRILCSAAINGSDFMCKIVIHGINFISGTALFNLTITLKESLDYFPLAISRLSKSNGKGKYIILTLNEIIHKTDKIHPVFIEAFKLGIMRIRDEQLITYDTVLRRTLE